MTSTRPHNALPTREKPSGYCPNPECGEFVRFEWPPSLADNHQERSIWPRLDSLSQATELQIRQGIWSCPACEQTCVVFIHRQKMRQVDEEGKPYSTYVGTPTLIWPARRPRELEASVPEKIRDLFAEGSVVEHAGALRAAAALYRATVEALCADRGTQGRNLEDKINDLKNRGVDAGIVDDLHEARFLGNWSLHRGTAFTADEVADVADLIVEATVELYVQPAERARMREARRARRNGSSD